LYKIKIRREEEQICFKTGIFFFLIDIIIPDIAEKTYNKVIIKGLSYNVGKKLFFRKAKKREGIERLKLLWIGVDGFSFRMVEKTRNRYFSALMNDSRYGISVSEFTDEPVPYTGPNWASLYTGVVPEKHGITDAGWLLENMKYQDIKVNTVFDIIDKHYTQALMTLPLTYPAFDVNGWMISGFPTPDSLDDCYFPEDIGALLGKKFKISHAKCTRGMSWDSITDPKKKMKFKERFFYLAKSHIETFKNIYSKRNTEIAFVGLTYIDRMNHIFTQKDTALVESYAEMYAILEELISFYRPDNLILCSDHGFEEGVTQHDKYGFYLIRSCIFPKGRKDISITEIAPSVLKILDIDMDLGVPVERAKKKVGAGKLGEIKQRLRALGYI
jgi:predicted AlkP superfamily phosphohydrolase/phosphomutase